MEEALSGHLMDFVMTALGSAVFGLIGFVWKISHKVSALEKLIETQSKMQSRDVSELRKDIDVIYNNVDKNREWTTNRMMSIAKEIGN
tara:strand:- start:56 stop:319 length:264 start_codon:yes stop_codon:yes gene_type:complete